MSVEKLLLEFEHLDSETTVSDNQKVRPRDDCQLNFSNKSPERLPKKTNWTEVGLGITILALVMYVFTLRS